MALSCFLQSRQCPDPIDECQIGTGLEVEITAANRFLQSRHGIGVRAGIDDEFRVEIDFGSWHRL